MSPLEQITTKHLSSLFFGGSLEPQCGSNSDEEEPTLHQESSGLMSFCLLYLGMGMLFFCISAITDKHTQHQSRLKKERRQRGRSLRYRSIAPRRRRPTVSGRKHQRKGTEEYGTTDRDVWQDPSGQEEKDEDQQQGDFYFDTLSYAEGADPHP
ncbi:uncharacterized protein LOC111072460 [Drosophila obscura]|uniref:uncharacterized protein LOC111072460 n=1 Tax=Drosophila obscura TaxID=7282 RepID=UPI001BB24E94|nr:uncharacterized protein LOC111072460 [Drosophila obscura]